MKSSNPIFKNEQQVIATALNGMQMTASGTINKLMIMALIMIISAAAVYYQFSLGRIDYVNKLTSIGIITGFGAAIAIFVKKHLAKYFVPIYAFAEGAALSGISCFFEQSYPGIVIQAISITFLIVLSMGICYKTKLIEATNKFRSTIFMGCIGISLFYGISFILMLFKINVPYFTSNSPLNILINFIFAMFAALCLIVDFDNIEKWEKNLYPSYYEWIGAYGLLTTILWLYLEILRLLSRLKDR